LSSQEEEEFHKLYRRAADFLAEVSEYVPPHRGLVNMAEKKAVQAKRDNPIKSVNGVEVFTDEDEFRLKELKRIAWPTEGEKTELEALVNKFNAWAECKAKLPPQLQEESVSKVRSPHGIEVPVFTEEDGHRMADLEKVQIASCLTYGAAKELEDLQKKFARWKNYFTSQDPQKEQVNHPPHYNAGSIEVIDAIEAWGLGFNDGNVVKYVARAKHKGGLTDLKKALWYLQRHIANVEKGAE
jgi:hypothetical protein